MGVHTLCYFSRVGLKGEEMQGTERYTYNTVTGVISYMCVCESV